MQSIATINVNRLKAAVYFGYGAVVPTIGILTAMEGDTFTPKIVLILLLTAFAGGFGAVKALIDQDVREAPQK